MTGVLDIFRIFMDHTVTNLLTQPSAYQRCLEKHQRSTFAATNLLHRGTKQFGSMDQLYRW